MTYGKTIQELRAEYAPYDSMPEFDDGMRDYHSHCSWQHLEGIAAQAYDRGLECAMRLARHEAWVAKNVGAD